MAKATAELVQMLLRSGTAVRVCWLPATVRRRQQVTLDGDEDPGRQWTVDEVYDGHRKTAAELAAYSAGGAVAAMITAIGAARARARRR